MKYVICALIGAIALSAVGGGTAQETISMRGSDTMVILAQQWAEKYMSNHPDVTVQVTGGGSGSGISALINGTTDICNASRPMNTRERDRLKVRSGSYGVEIKVAKDGLAVYVNDTNPVAELNLEQLKGIYTGVITNWKAVGGRDEQIIVYGRENNSGTYVYFKDDILDGDDYAPDMQSMPGTATVVHAVANDSAGIGYGGAAYGKGIREIRVKMDDTAPAYAPTAEHIKSGDYPLTRFLYIYVRTRPAGAIKAYIDWILSDEGQAVVNDVGYFPIR